MTDGEEPQPLDSQGSFQGVLQQMVQEFCENNSLQALNGSVPDIGLLENSPLLEENENQPISPDSGYLQPQSNSSSIGTMNSDVVPYVPVSTVITGPDLYEIEPQPLVFNPPTANYPGNYQFQLLFEQTDHASKNANYTYSHLLNKLYVKMNVPCPVKFQCIHPMPEGSHIRAMLVFTKGENICQPVCRCANHIQMDQSHDLSEHVLQTVSVGNSHDDPTYHFKNGRYSVTVPVCDPGVGQQYSVVLYKFMCLLSCIGGMNRRPVMVIFTLEDRNGNTLGRCCVDVKICSSPGRDRKKEEERFRKPSSSHNVPLPRKRPRTLTPTENESSNFRFLKVRRENYAILSEINDALNLAAMATEEQKERCRQEDRKDEFAQVLAKFCRENL